MQPLLAPPRDRYIAELGSVEAAEAFVRAAFDLSRGPKVRHGVEVLDENDDPTGEDLQIETGQVRYSYRPDDRVTGQTTDVRSVRHQASLTIVEPTIPLGLRRYLIYTEFLATGDEWVRSDLGIYVPTLPPLADDGRAVRSQLELADKCRLYADDELEEPYSIPAGTNMVQSVIDDLADWFGETEFAITSSTVTNVRPLTFPAGTSRLETFNVRMKVAGYDQLTSDFAGRPSSVPLETIASKGSEMTYGAGEGKIKVEGQIAPLLPSLYNVVQFVARQGPSLPTEGNGVRTVKNQSTGPASIDERGRRFRRVQVDAEGQTELDAIAYGDAPRWFGGGGRRFEGRVGLNPLMGDRDLVTILLPRLEVDGLWHVTDWTYPLAPITGEDAITMQLTAEQFVTVEADV